MSVYPQTLWSSIPDEWDHLTRAKMRALGVEEAMLSGDVLPGSMDRLLSKFLEKVHVLREQDSSGDHEQ